MSIVEADCYTLRGRAVELAAETLKRAGLVVAPTDTVYGLLADPFNPQALERVYRVKGRDPGKPVPLLLGESHHAFLVVQPSERFWRLAARFWPGPLTIVERPAPRLPKHLEAWGNMGVRLPRCPLVRELASRIGGVVVGTSANRSGAESPRTVYDAYAQLGEAVDLYIDGGPALLGEPSTVVDVTAAEPQILREGGVKREEIMRVLAEG